MEKKIPSTYDSFHTISIGKGHGLDFTVPTRYQSAKRIGYSSATKLVCSATDVLKDKTVTIIKNLSPFSDLRCSKATFKDIKLLTHFKHENVLSLLDLFAYGDDIYYVTENMEADLHMIIRGLQKLTDDHVGYLIYQLLLGLNYIHSSGTIHANLKPGVILVNSDCSLKISGLELACSNNLALQYHEELTVFVPRWYGAPEAVLNDRKIGKPADIWAAGCIMAELITKEPLFPCTSQIDSLNRVVGMLGKPSEEDMEFINNPHAKKVFQNMPQSAPKGWNEICPTSNSLCLDVLSKMLVFNPGKRYTAKQCLEHPYFERFRDDVEVNQVCDTPFDWSFMSLTKEQVKNMAFEVIGQFVKSQLLLTYYIWISMWF
eukprot:TRINITY_DN121158_c0_g1_i1.p1 TRINITY_DN121158_c0_g1~~TRINITY_DN121158_c0_g1_i1.p1  ORF type:complete len:401 (-),score=14.82 TRINITY_DN121158_c0_g1_i1:54-1175(-)